MGGHLRIESLALLACLFSCVHAQPAGPREEACFLLHQVGSVEDRRGPDALCAVALSPASTFKIPHALCALDAGVVAGPEAAIAWDGVRHNVEAWNRDHTLASAVRYSVLWYFQRLAERLGPEREADCLRRLGYGNGDASSSLTGFWLGGSLRISPEQQLRFLDRLAQGKLPFAREQIAAVLQLIEQPAHGIQRGDDLAPFGARAQAKVVVRAKSGSVDSGDDSVRWLVGLVEREGRTFSFVSVVRRRGALLRGPEAIELADRRLEEEGVWEGLR